MIFRGGYCFGFAAVMTYGRRMKAPAYEPALDRHRRQPNGLLPLCALIVARLAASS